MSEQKMLSIWFFVSFMLIVLGLIITATGVYYIFRPQNNTVLAHLNPNLWWGAIILIAGLVLLFPSLREYRSKK